MVKSRSKSYNSIQQIIYHITFQRGPLMTKHFMQFGRPTWSSWCLAMSVEEHSFRIESMFTENGAKELRLSRTTYQKYSNLLQSPNQTNNHLKVQHLSLTVRFDIHQEEKIFPITITIRTLSIIIQNWTTTSQICQTIDTPQSKVITIAQSDILPGLDFKTIEVQHLTIPPIIISSSSSSSSSQCL